MNNHEYIRELFRVVSIDSILVINRQGKLRRIHCPFRAVVVIPVGEFVTGKTVLVEAVKMTLDLQDVFVVKGKAYFLIHFKIMLDER
jgi:hypothetical protein